MVYQWPYIPNDEMYNEKMDTRNEILRVWAEKGAGKIVPNSWNHVQELVHAGLHNKVFHIKDKLICQKSGSNIDWVVIGKDIDTPSDNQYNHTMTLQTQKCIEELQFDAPEAFYYTDEGLAAGTYYFTIDSTFRPENNNFSAYQFTLTQSIPAGGQLFFDWTIGQNMSTAEIKSFSSALDTVALETVYLIEGTNGTNLGELKLIVQPALKLNSLQRILSGSNNYKESAIRQWLNSDKAAGQVWTPQTGWDRPPTWLSTANGFMYGMDADFLETIQKTHVITARDQTIEGGSTYDETDDYFFLLAKSQVYGTPTDEIVEVNEGSAYPYFKDYSFLSASGSGTDQNRIKLKSGVAEFYWLRSYVSSNTHLSYNCMVTSSGALYKSIPMASTGITPACNIIG